MKQAASTVLPYAGQPARLDTPSEQPAGRSGTAEKRREETDQPYRRRLLPLAPEHFRVELRAGEESEHDGPGAGKELDPPLIAAQHRRAHQRADEQLREGTDHDLGKRRRHAQPDRYQRRDERESQPKCRKRPGLGHRSVLTETKNAYEPALLRRVT